MAVTYNPFISKSGFKSEGFEVNTTGDVTAQDITALNLFTTTIDTTTLKINGIPLFGGDNSSTSTFQIESDFIVSEGSTPFLSIINGRVVITNRFDSVGSIDNVEIGANIPAAGTFTSIRTGELGVPVLESSTNLSLSAANAIVFQINGTNKGRVDSNGISVPVVNTTINNTSIGATTPSTGSFTSVTISNQPTLPSNATRKDYVDNQISAFAIAFGI